MYARKYDKTISSYPMHLFLQALQDDIITLDGNLGNITKTGIEFQERGDELLKATLASQLKDLRQRWDITTGKAKVQNAELKQALDKSQKVWDESDRLIGVMNEIQDRIPVFTAETTNELNGICDSFDALKKEIDRNAPKVSEFNLKGN